MTARGVVTRLLVFPAGAFGDVIAGEVRPEAVPVGNRAVPRPASHLLRYGRHLGNNNNNNNNNNNTHNNNNNNHPKTDTHTYRVEGEKQPKTDTDTLTEWKVKSSQKQTQTHLQGGR